MRITRLAFFAALLLLLFAFSAYAEAEGYLPGVFILPESVQSIEESAFEGSAASEVWMPNGLKRIGPRAFADMPKLKTVFIPESVTSIRDNAFDGLNDLVIVGVKDSYAQEYAQKHGYLFIRYEVWLVTYKGYNYGWQAYRHTSSLKCADTNDVEQLRMSQYPYEEIVRSPKERPEMLVLDYVFP